MIEKISVEIRVLAERVLNVFRGEYTKHFKELSVDHIERIITVKSADFEHPDVSFYFKQYSPITGRVQKNQRQGDKGGASQENWGTSI